MTQQYMIAYGSKQHGRLTVFCGWYPWWLIEGQKWWRGRKCSQASRQRCMSNDGPGELVTTEPNFAVVPHASLLSATGWSAMMTGPRAWHGSLTWMPSCIRSNCSACGPNATVLVGCQARILPSPIDRPHLGTRVKSRYM